MTKELRRIVEGLTFPEGLRWRDGRLWFSDFYSHAVYATDLSGNYEKIADVQNQPSGLGWLPNGDLLISSMIDHPCWSCAVTGDPRDGIIVALSDHSARDDCVANMSGAIALIRQ